jgi:lipopolysaccharide export LptBFGC system permease protein LptF
MDSPAPVASRGRRHAAIAWTVTLVLSAALVFPLSLKHPKHHYTIGARVFAGLIIWLGLAVIFRFLGFAVNWLQDRSAAREVN